MEEYWQELITFFKASYTYTLAITFFICMAESIVGLSLLVPSTAILISFSVLMSASGLDFLTLLLVAGLGASFGDWISFSLGYYSKDSLQKRWPLRNNPDWLIKGASFFERWGWVSMFIARFMGPLRSITPLTAGIFRMPIIQFAIVSLLSSFFWAGIVLSPGGIGGHLIGQ